MDIETLLIIFRDSLASVVAPRYYETERGFQGAFIAELSKRIPGYVSDAIVEQEYQKRLTHHNLKIRPDIIIHEPFDPTRHANRRAGNIAVIELKLSASQAEATKDFKSLAAMINDLDYPLGIFINIASDATHFQLVPPEAKGRITCFAVSLNKGRTQVVENQLNGSASQSHP